MVKKKKILRTLIGPITSANQWAPFLLIFDLSRLSLSTSWDSALWLALETYQPITGLHFFSSSIYHVRRCWRLMTGVLIGFLILQPIMLSVSFFLRRHGRSLKVRPCCHYSIQLCLECERKQLTRSRTGWWKLFRFLWCN